MSVDVEGPSRSDFDLPRSHRRTYVTSGHETAVTIPKVRAHRPVTRAHATKFECTFSDIPCRIVLIRTRNDRDRRPIPVDHSLATPQGPESVPFSRPGCWMKAHRLVSAWMGLRRRFPPLPGLSATRTRRAVASSTGRFTCKERSNTHRTHRSLWRVCGEDAMQKLRHSAVDKTRLIDYRSYIGFTCGCLVTSWIDISCSFGFIGK